MFVLENVPEVVALGGSTPQRIRGREAVAESKFSIHLRDSAALENYRRQLGFSDKRLIEMGPKDPGHDWQFVMSESFEDGSSNVHFGVAWHDTDFFTEKKPIFEYAKHSRMLSAMGVMLANVAVEHRNKVT